MPLNLDAYGGCHDKNTVEALEPMGFCRHRSQPDDSRSDGRLFTRGCAARDLQILFLIEEQEGVGSLPAERLSDALIEMMHARIVCHEGRVLDALAIYDAVAETLRPIRSGRAHNQASK